MNPWTDQASAFLARSRAVRVLARLYRERLTGAGKLMLVGTMWALLLGVDYTSPIYNLWCLGAGVLAASILAGTLAGRLRVRARRHLPRHVCAGEKVFYEVQIQDISGRTARDLEVEEFDLPRELKPGPPPTVARLDPGQTAAVRLSLECRKRGVYPLSHLTVSSSFPSGLFRALDRQDQEDQLLVYPAFHRLAAFNIPTPRRYQPGGLSLTSDVGDSTEFMSTRDFRYGDSIRDIHWASWARTGKPVVKEYQEEYFARLGLLMDSQVPAGTDDRAFEAGISLAASVADVLSRRDYIIDIFAAGDQIHRFQAGRALAHFDNILEILACLTAAPRVDMTAVLNAIEADADRISALVCIFMDWDDDRRRLVESLSQRGLALRALVVRDDEPTLPIISAPNVVWHRPDQALGEIG